MKSIRFLITTLFTIGLALNSQPFLVIGFDENPTDLVFSEKQPTVVDTFVIYKQNVIASFYHKKFEGKKTASGEVFSNEKYTAAHKTLPFGTLLKVVNLSNQKEVVVRVNDRGPFSKTKEIDLSQAAFLALTDSFSEGHLVVDLQKVE